MTDTSRARLDVVNKFAAKYGLDAVLVCSVVEQESAWNPWAIRYEPAFEQRYVAPQGHDATEQKARSISWGYMQIMGQVARELGFKGNLASLCDPDVGIDWGCQKLLQCINATDSVEAALLRWNGGGNPNYGQQVLARMANYQSA